jgi:hypothetical protein
MTKAYCNACGGERNHDILHSEETRWEDDEWHAFGSDTYETLRCCGCEAIKLRHTSYLSVRDDPVVSYFPASISRPRPELFKEPFWVIIGNENRFVGDLLREIYVALQHDLPSLAAMGVRSLLEKIMISKTGDLGSFAKNIAKFQELGYVSRIQRERLETILDAGHAAIHREVTPSKEDLITLVDFVEHIVVTVYLHEMKVSSLKLSVPPRASASKSSHPESGGTGE